MKSLPASAVAYQKTPVFTRETIPGGLLQDHRTKAGVWGLIVVEQGSLQYTIGDAETHILTPGRPGVVEPAVTHYVKPLGEVTFFVEFYRDAPD